MRFHRSFDSILQRPATVKVLRPLVRYASREFTGRELARVAGVSAQQTLRCLGDLEREGLVRGGVLGAARLWSWRSDHILSPVIESLFQKEGVVLDELVALIRTRLVGTKVRRARIYGSVASGAETPTSDVDLLIEAKLSDLPELSGPISSLVQEVSRVFGNTLSPILIDPSRFHPDALHGMLREVDRLSITVMEEGR